MYSIQLLYKQYLMMTPQMNYLKAYYLVPSANKGCVFKVTPLVIIGKYIALAYFFCYKSV